MVFPSWFVATLNKKREGEKMKRKFLEGLGIESEVIDKIMSEHGTTVQGLQTSVNDLISERDEFKRKLETKETEYTTLEKSLNSKTKDYDALKSDSDKNSSLLNQYQNKDVLAGLGVDSKYVDFVSHEVSSKKGDKDFKEYAESYLKENAQYKAGNKQTIQTQPNWNGNPPAENPNSAFNSALRKALRKE